MHHSVTIPQLQWFSIALIIVARLMYSGECYQMAHNRTFIYFLQSTCARCDIIVLLSIYDVIQSPQFLEIVCMAHTQTVDTRYQAHLQCGLVSRLQ